MLSNYALKGVGIYRLMKIRITAKGIAKNQKKN
jgi:hypothetical protein